MHHPPRTKPVHTPAVRWAVGLLAASSLQLSAVAMTGSTPPAIVGEATMVIGTARITNAQGQTVAVDKGAAIRVGDRIETEAGGHVHLRFVDGGRVSVRPASRLHIESYAHSSDKPALNAIKFRLDEGVVRYLVTLYEHELGAPKLSDEELASRRRADGQGTHVRRFVTPR